VFENQKKWLKGRKMVKNKENGQKVEQIGGKTVQKLAENQKKW
jgi:hypothetical protein